MTHTTLITCVQLADLLQESENLAIVDCRFSLEDSEYGLNQFLSAHIPRAAYAHLNKDLSSQIIPGKTGRHPLVDPGKLALRFSSWGIDHNTQVVVYDDSGGGNAARLWWLLNWTGHEAVALLDGGWQAWVAGGYPTEKESATLILKQFKPRMRHELLMDTKDVIEMLHTNERLLVDSRTSERYRGEVEPIDPVAGHIPGAVNLPYTGNMDEKGFFLPPEQLKTRFQAILGDTPPASAVFYCGSGVTAAHNLLALKHAGLGEAKLYNGSWSEWIADPTRPVEKS